MKKVEAFVIEDGNKILIHFERFTKIEDFSKFIELNQLKDKRVVFSPEKPKKSEKKTLTLPTVTRFEKMKEELIKRGLI